MLNNNTNVKCAMMSNKIKLSRGFLNDTSTSPLGAAERLFRTRTSLNSTVADSGA